MRLAATLPQVTASISPVSLAVASQSMMYVVSRGSENNFGSRVSKLYVGAPGEEKVHGEFCRYGTDPGRALWPNSVALDKQGNVYVSDDWLNRIWHLIQMATF